MTEFAKKTGDYASLSATDIKLMALAYQMEIENVGRDHLKSEPVVPKFAVNSKTPRVMNFSFCAATCGYRAKRTDLWAFYSLQVNNDMNDHEDSEYDTARSGSSTDDDEFHSDELNEDERENGISRAIRYCVCGHIMIDHNHTARWASYWRRFGSHT